ncbi:MAG: hypothetical protein GF350_11880 [Chitinivibrionales bacterium]|nr:hypothetical protein [Chitinivibrionales bacterium]
MKDRYLEITYRKGTPFAAYLYLSRKLGIKSTKSKKIENGLIADFDETGKPIGFGNMFTRNNIYCPDKFGSQFTRDNPIG